MSSLLVALVVFAFTFAGALVGLYLNRRLPAPHLEGDSRDVVKLVMGLIATMAALVLGLLISSAHRAHMTQEEEVQQMAIHLFQLDRALSRYGPEAAETREHLHRFVKNELAKASAPGGLKAAADVPLESQRGATILADRILSLKPANEVQRYVQARAIHLVGTLTDTRLLLSEQARTGISWPFLVVLVFWLTFLFMGFGLFARRNGTVVAALCLGALSVGGAVFLILDMYLPYRGVMHTSLEPIRATLDLMSR
ncbi:MAG: hypothetical protein IT518_13705 [Burkholderiales bacterium]|nr:hypothetical protein [Burkholderiales bacterium]